MGSGTFETERDGLKAIERKAPKFNRELVEHGVKSIIEGIGDNVDRPDLKETPERCGRMFEDILGGYDIDPMQYLKLFPCESNDMVIERNIPFYSYCAHHIQPFFGKLTIAYIPDGKVLGLSKLVRIARVFAKRLQIQENLTAQIAQFLETNVPNQGVAVSIRASHMCMHIRGVRSPGSEAVTTHLSGLFKEDAKAREEFLMQLSDKEGYL